MFRIQWIVAYRLKCLLPSNRCCKVKCIKAATRTNVCHRRQDLPEASKVMREASTLEMSPNES